MDLTLPESAVEYWCRGARLAGERSLTDVEARWIRRLRDLHAERAGYGLTLAPLVVIGFALLGFALMRAPRLAESWTFMVTLSLGLLLALPITVLLVRDHVRTWFRLGRDLRDGVVDVFEFPRARAAADEDPHPAATHEPPRGFGLLPWSRRIVATGALTTDTATEVVLELDPHQAIELYAPLSLRVSTSDPDLEFAQRPLSAGERGELDRVRRQLTLPRPSTALAFVVMVMLLGIARLVAEGYGDRIPRWDEVLSLVMALMICVRALMRYTRSVLLAGRLGRDLDTGLVVRVVGGDPGDAEMLPFSRLFWRVAGAPADWRDRRRGADTLRESL